MNEVSEEKSTESVGQGSDECEGRIHTKYLISAVQYLKEIPSNALRCHWNILLADILHMKGLARCGPELLMPGRCPYCQIAWVDGHYHVGVMPKRKRRKKLRKLLRRANEQKELSRVQKSLFRVLHLGPSVVLNCNICHKSTTFKIRLHKKNYMVSPNVKSVLQDYQDMLDPWEKNTMKKKRGKKKTWKSSPFGTDITTEMQDKNECNNNGITMQNITESKPIRINKIKNKIKIKPIKRKLSNYDDDDDDDDDDGGIHTLPPEPQVTKKIKKDVFVENPLQIKPLGVSSEQSGPGDIHILPSEPQVTKKNKKDAFIENPLQTKLLGVSSEQSGQCNTRNNHFMSLDTFKQTTKVNISSRKSYRSQGKQRKKSEEEVVSINHPQCGKKKNNLSRWKKLIADQEAKAIKTSLQDFLSAL